jgi:hypothetical protein
MEGSGRDLFHGIHSTAVERLRKISQSGRPESWEPNLGPPDMKQE